MILAAIPALAVGALGFRRSLGAPEIVDPEEAAKGQLVLKVDGGAETTIALDALNHNEVEAGSKNPDTFEFTGTGVLLAGAFPPTFKPNADAEWKTLVGKPIPIRPKLGDVQSELTLAGEEKPAKLAPGSSFTIDGLKTEPLRVKGQIILKLRTAAGVKSAAGTFDVGVIRYG